MDKKISSEESALINISEQFEIEILYHLFSALENLSTRASNVRDVKAIIKLSKFIKKILNNRNYFVMIDNTKCSNNPPNSCQNNV